MEEKLQILNSFYKHHRRMPTYSEMMVMFNYKSKNAVSKLVQKFVRYGVLEKDTTGRIIPSTKQGPVRLLRLIES